MDGDRADLEIEEFGLAENLMIEVAIVDSGGRVVRRDVPAGSGADRPGGVRGMPGRYRARPCAKVSDGAMGSDPHASFITAGGLPAQGLTPYANLLATSQATAAGTPNTTISTGSSTLKGMLAQ